MASSPPPIADPQYICRRGDDGRRMEKWPAGCRSYFAREGEGVGENGFRANPREARRYGLRLAASRAMRSPTGRARDHGLIAQYLDPHTLSCGGCAACLQTARVGWRQAAIGIPTTIRPQRQSPKRSRALDARCHADGRGNPACVGAGLRGFQERGSRRSRPTCPSSNDAPLKTDAESDARLLRTFRKTWDTLAGELQ